MTSRPRRAAVAVSVEALLHQWARQEAAPAGSAIVVDAEISARSRGGVEWRVDSALAVGVVARPAALDPTSADLGWLATGLGARAALAGCLGGGGGCWWPDRLDLDQPESPADRELQVGISAGCSLGPGTIDHGVLAVRVGPVADGQRDRLADALVDHLRAAAAALDRPDSLITRYRGACTTLGRDVEVTRLLHGTLRGRADDIDDAGRLVLVSPTGLRQPLAIDTVGAVTPC